MKDIITVFYRNSSIRSSAFNRNLGNSGYCSGGFSSIRLNFNYFVFAVYLNFQVVSRFNGSSSDGGHFFITVTVIAQPNFAIAGNVQRSIVCIVTDTVILCLYFNSADTAV